MDVYENIIEIKNVTKRYEGFCLDNISFTVPAGSITGFIGQNGAGKTTTIKSILNLTSIDSGEIKLFGLDHIKDETAVKERIAVVFDELPFHEVLTPKKPRGDLFRHIQKMEYRNILCISKAFRSSGRSKDRQVFKRYENETADRLRALSQCRASDNGRGHDRT